ncbi:hypothetical protein S83_037003 [Arachis hypogaea]
MALCSLHSSSSSFFLLPFTPLLSHSSLSLSKKLLSLLILHVITFLSPLTPDFPFRSHLIRLPEYSPSPPLSLSLFAVGEPKSSRQNHFVLEWEVDFLWYMPYNCD